MNKLRLTVASLLTVVGLASTPLLLSSTVSAQACSGSVSDCITQGQEKVKSGSGGPKLEDQIKNIVNVMLFILGAIAVIMIIIGGMRYAMSNGDAAAVKSGKDTVLYAVIGLIVAILAYAIVNFVVTSFK